MNDPTQVRITVTSGPGLAVPFPAVIAELRPPGGREYPAAEIGARLRAFLPPVVAGRLALPLQSGRFEAVVAAITGALQDIHGANGFPAQATRDERGRCIIAIGYADAAAAFIALQAALDFAAALFRTLAGAPVDGPALARRLQDVAARMLARQPDGFIRALIRAAAERRIPVLPVAPGSRVWQFGQGSRGIHFFEAASERDAMTGTRLARNKLASNQLITALGLPGVRHRDVASAEEARRVARELGYPVVVKPAKGGKGQGVTAGIGEEAGIGPAFEAASAAGAGPVLVEAHVAGDDHRLVAIGGTFAWAVRRAPPRVQGDGRSTIGELVAAENLRRKASLAAELGAGPILLDADATALLAARGLTAASVPEAGAEVTLGRVANLARGGTLTDCTDAVHPDNRAMAEALARAFRLDAIGIDFLTPDITRSWRDVACGVIEVNATPGFSSDERAGRVIRARFPPGGHDGRIPAVVLVGDPASIDAAVTQLRAAAGPGVGVATRDGATLAGLARRHAAAELPAQLRALVLDRGCTALVAGTTPGEIAQGGVPARPLPARGRHRARDAHARAAPAGGRLRRQRGRGRRSGRRGRAGARGAPRVNYEAIFRARGAAYAAAMRRWPEARREEFLRPVQLAAVAPGETVLDVPAGGGYLRRYLPAGSRWRGHEPCAGFFDDGVARDADLLPLPFADGEADVAISIAGVHHLRDKRPLFRELHRCLRPGGRLVLADAHAGSGVALFLDGFVGRYNSTGHEGVYLDAGTVADAEAAGFAVERVEQLRYAWWFPGREAMAAFCRELFDIRAAALPLIVAEIESQLGIVTRDEGAGGEVGMNWELRALLCRKPS